MDNSKNIEYTSIYFDINFLIHFQEGRWEAITNDSLVNFFKIIKQILMDNLVDDMLICDIICYIYNEFFRIRSRKYLNISDQTSDLILSHDLKNSSSSTSINVSNLIRSKSYTEDEGHPQMSDIDISEIHKTKVNEDDNTSVVFSFNISEPINVQKINIKKTIIFSKDLLEISKDRSYNVNMIVNLIESKKSESTVRATLKLTSHYTTNILKFIYISADEYVMYNKDIRKIDTWNHVLDLLTKI